MAALRMNLLVVVVGGFSAWALPVRRAAAQRAPLAESFHSVRVESRAQKVEEGWFLFSFGAASIAAGTPWAIAVNSDPFHLWAGVGTATWGAVNLLLSTSMLDLGGAQTRRIERERTMNPEEARLSLRQQLSAENNGVGLFAFNAGLDVFYIASAALLYVLGDQLAHREPGLMGYASAQMAQGAVLLGFDIFCWIRSGNRSSRYMGLTFD